MENMPAVVVLSQYIGDCAKLAAQLDSVGSRDGCVLMAATLIIGQKEYQSLLARRDEMPAAEANGQQIQILLDNLLARLKFLEMRTRPSFSPQAGQMRA